MAVATLGSPPTAAPGRAVRAVGLLAALWCLGFAAVNVGFELTGRFTDGPLAGDAASLAVMNGLVAALKVVGAAVALLAVHDRQRVVRPATLAVLLWGAFATLATYVVGAVVEAIAFATGLAGDRSDLTLRSGAYLLFFLVAAVCFGVLARSHARRHHSPRRLALLGALAAPVVLGTILLVLPTVLGALGLLSTT